MTFKNEAYAIFPALKQKQKDLGSEADILSVAVVLFLITIERTNSSEYHFITRNINMVIEKITDILEKKNLVLATTIIPSANYIFKSNRQSSKIADEEVFNDIIDNLRKCLSEKKEIDQDDEESINNKNIGKEEDAEGGVCNVQPEKENNDDVAEIDTEIHNIDVEDEMEENPDEDEEDVASIDIMDIGAECYIGCDEEESTDEYKIGFEENGDAEYDPEYEIIDIE